MWASLKELEEATLPIARLLVRHVAGKQLRPLVGRLKEAPRSLATYVKHLARLTPNEVLTFLKSYFPKVIVDVVAGGVTTNCSDEQFCMLLEEMTPITEQVVEKLNLQ